MNDKPASGIHFNPCVHNAVLRVNGFYGGDFKRRLRKCCAGKAENRRHRKQNGSHTDDYTSKNGLPIQWTATDSPFQHNLLLDADDQRLRSESEALLALLGQCVLRRGQGLPPLSPHPVWPKYSNVLNHG